MNRSAEQQYPHVAIVHVRLSTSLYSPKLRVPESHLLSALSAAISNAADWQMNADKKELCFSLTERILGAVFEVSNTLAPDS